MPSLQNKNILLGVSGGIAAYKAAEIIRLLQKSGADVRVVMTFGAQAFITPLTLQALSGHAVHTELLDSEAEAGMGHIELARWADLTVVAPASASFMARLCSGLGSDLLTALCLATKSVIALAPAMNQAMWSNRATQQNSETLKARGVELWGPAEGVQACGDIGLGRMLEPVNIVEQVFGHFATGELHGKTVVITAGPTQEPLDPVRYISNYSSGKMGYALAAAAVEAGAKTILISGPTALTAPDHTTLIHVQTARQMLAASMDSAKGAHVFISAAAVSDYRPVEMAEQKIKKTATDKMTLKLIKNPDIVACIAASKKRPFIVGFAAETNNLIEYAEEKLHKKNLDLIVANDVSNKRIGFNSDNNAVTLIDQQSNTEIAECNKNQLARKLIKNIAKRIL